MTILSQLAALMLGLLSGAMLFIALALVPYWQSLEPSVFLQWFGDNSHFIARVMLPLGAGATLLTCIAAGIALWKKMPGRMWMAVAAFCALLMFIMFPLYFRAVNAAFVQGAVEAQEVAAALAQWQRMHWVRVGAAIAGCCCMLSVIAMRR